MPHDPMVPRRQILGGIGTAIGVATAGCSSSVPAVGGDRSVEVPERTLIGRTLPIRLSGFAPFTTVSLTAQTTARYQGRKLSYRGETQVTTDVFGAATVDLSSIADGGGPGMVLWDLKPTAEYLNYFVAGGKSSFDIRISVTAGDWSRSIQTTRVYRNPEVKRQTINDEGIHGRLYEPPSSGRTPGVVFLRSFGGNIGARVGGVGDLFCWLLATQGYTVLSVRYFGDDLSDLPDTLARVPLEYFRRTIAWLESKESIEDPVGLVGVLSGGEAALLTGATFNHDGPVISYSGSSLVSPGDNGSPAWTYDGDPVATMDELRRFTRELQDSIPTERRTEWPDLLDRIPEEVREPVVIPVEEIEGPVLLLSGLSGPLWNPPQSPPWDPAQFHRIAENRLTRANHSSRHEHLTFQNAGHIFWAPYINYLDWTGGDWRGEEKPTARAAARSWPQTLSYLSV